MIDTHAHLFWDSFQEDLDEIIQRSLDSGVNIFINVGVDLETSQKAVDQVKNKLSKIDGLTSFAAIGIHPHEAIKYAKNLELIKEDIAELESLYNQNPDIIKGIGECGLDFFFRTNDLHPDLSLPVEDLKKLQIMLFQAQIDLAKKLNLPLLVHCRDDRSENSENTEAWDKVLEMTKDHFGIYHCYSGLINTTNQAIQKNKFIFSFAANITYPNAKNLHEAAKIIPLDRITTETDCPFLPPQDKRGMRNEPANVVEVVKKNAQIKELSEEEVASKTTENAKRIFQL